MRITKKIRIEKPASEVWKILATDFDKAGDWMSVVKKSYVKEGDHEVIDAPMSGRVCELSAQPNGLRAYETITDFDEDNRSMSVDIVPANTPKLFPITKNTLCVSVMSIGHSSSRVIWSVEPQLKSYARLMAPLVKLGLGKAFMDVLEELKFYAETGKPHPRNELSVN